MLASLASALAPSVGILIIFRVAQGAAAAAFILQVMGLIRAMFQREELGRALSSIGPVLGLSGVCGPILGGVLIQVDLFGFSWHAAFLVNIPLSIAALIIAPLLSEDVAPAAPVVRPARPAVATRTRRQRAHRGSDPGALVGGHGAGILDRYLVPRYGQRVMFAGLATLVLGVLGAIAAYHAARPLSYPAPLLGALGAAGLGIGLFCPPFFTAALRPVRPQEIGSAADLLNAVQELGATIGIAILGSVYLGASAAVPRPERCTPPSWPSGLPPRCSRRHSSPARSWSPLGRRLASHNWTRR